jgi:predicted glycoside hydrolase/deacetylase ChbG (UPF0249 family)
VRNALLRRFDQEALEAEIRSQADVFLRLFGRAPDFIDGHQHVHLLPQIGEAVLCVAKEVAPNGWVRQCGQGVPLLATVADPKGFFLDLLSRRFRHRAAALGVRTNPAFAGTYEFTDTADFSRLFPRFLANLPQDGLLMCHPGFVDAELLRLDPLTALREREHAFLASDRFVGLLAREGVTLH